MRRTNRKGGDAPWRMTNTPCWVRWGFARRLALNFLLRGKVALVLLTADASERTVSHLQDACGGIVACEQMPLTSAELAMLTPKPAAVFGITDEHLAQLCAKHLI